ncbi:phosphodiester glycosidase family protein [Streptomyces albidocamelliae]|uniref:Phosphodiester glycosidase family protein n=1 Tax=Streptomyces albidocamelliae TaxID=2981135 RepID=A0ABY6EI35_9ACTN|nr:phosphodiester glycosidase family protein [Streptomyces sp. HUAS 14-6]UXY34452.1 phosphodiester glycosidase family protein [Streptomyces sp. HUAS 14-6]
MTRRRGRSAAGRAVLTVVTAFGVLAGAALAGAAPAGAAPAGRRIAPGVTYRQFDVDTAAGTAHAHLLTVDLANPHVGVDLLYPGAVAARSTVSRLADSAGAVAGINGDFFNITETQHPGVEATGAPVGPAVAAGQALKAAVPKGQRFGPALPPGTNTQEVLGVGTDRRARLDRLALVGSVTTPDGRLPLKGLNQYALPQGSVGAFTAKWGGVSRQRAVCGTDSERAAPCSDDTYEVTVRGGRVVAASGTPGSGTIAAGTTVLLGREEGARQLRKLSVGDPVTVEHSLTAATSGVPYAFAIGGFPVLRAGKPLSGLDDGTSAVRTVVGFKGGGQQLLILVLDGAARYRTGMTVAEEAEAMRTLGASDALNLDGGGSSELVAREGDAGAVSVRNHPSGGAERPVPNGIGIFSAA